MSKRQVLAVAMGAWFLVRAVAGGEAPLAEAPPVIQAEPGRDTRSIVAVKVDSAGVLKALPQWWSRNYQWQNVTFQCDRRAADGTTPFTWKVPGLGIEGRGGFRISAANQLQWEWHLTVQKEWRVEGEPGAKQPHGGLTFFLDLESAARRGCTAAPALKEDRTGFTWEVAPGKTITVGFSTPLASLYFERNNKHEIRCMFYEAPITPGKLGQAMTVTLPEGGTALAPAEERYAADTKDWFVGALSRDASFIDLSDLNERPAGTHGFVRAKGSALAFTDGTPARLWGMGLSAYTLFPRGRDGKTDKARIDRHAKRLAQLGCNLVRFTQADSNWVQPNLIAKGPTTDRLDDACLDTLFYWVKALKDQGIYVWLDMITYRPFLPGDNIPGWDEIVRTYNRPRPLGEGFSYLNPRIEELWRTTSRALLTRLNPHTGLALKDEPAIAGIMIWNENDLTGHFGHRFLGNKATPWHRQKYLAALKAFAAKTGLKEGPLGVTWLPGAGKLLLNDMEYRWNRRAAEFLRALGVRVPICSGHIWGNMALLSLPALKAGDVIDSHGYSRAEFLDLNPRYAGSAFHSIAMARLADSPKIISEYNMEAHGAGLDAFTTMPYLAAIAAFQGWDACMLYAYSQDALRGVGYSPWNSYTVPQTMGMAPAAALIYREGHVGLAAKTLFLSLPRDQAMFREVNERTSRAIRTAMERHRLTVGIGQIRELGWFKPTAAPAGAESVTDLNRDFIPPGDEVVSDTGELRRNWIKGIFVLDTPRTQLAMGRLKGETIRTADAAFHMLVPKAAVALSSLDRKALKASRRILVSTSARMSLNKDRQFLSEPVAGTITLASEAKGLRLVPLKSDGSTMEPIALRSKGGAYSIALPTDKGTHWFLLEGN